MLNLDPIFAANGSKIDKSALENHTMWNLARYMSRSDKIKFLKNQEKLLFIHNFFPKFFFSSSAVSLCSDATFS